MNRGPYYFFAAADFLSCFGFFTSFLRTLLPLPMGGTFPWLVPGGAWSARRERTGAAGGCGSIVMNAPGEITPGRWRRQVGARMCRAGPTSRGSSPERPAAATRRRPAAARGRARGGLGAGRVLRGALRTGLAVLERGDRRGQLAGPLLGAAQVPQFAELGVVVRVLRRLGRGGPPALVEGLVQARLGNVRWHGLGRSVKGGAP